MTNLLNVHTFDIRFVTNMRGSETLSCRHIISRSFQRSVTRHHVCFLKTYTSWETECIIYCGGADNARVLVDSRVCRRREFTVNQIQWLINMIADIISKRIGCCFVRTRNQNRSRCSRSVSTTKRLVMTLSL